MKRSAYRIRLLRKVVVLVAMAPLFQQIGWCSTGFNRTFSTALNGAPATYSNVLQGLGLLPLELLLGGQLPTVIPQAIDDTDDTDSHDHNASGGGI